MRPSELSAFGAVVFVFGTAFGAIAVEQGASVWHAVAMSALVTTGASQIAMLSVVGDGGSMLAGLLAAWFVATRFTLLGLSVAPRLPFGPLERAAAAHVLIDGSAAAALRCAPGRAAGRAYWAMGITIFCTWVGGTLVGAFAGAQMSSPESWGLDAALPTMLLALIVPELRSPGPRNAAVLGFAVAVIAGAFVQTGIAVLLAGALAWAGARRLEPCP